MTMEGKSARHEFYGLEHANMITFILMLKRKGGLSKEQFREHYETSHVALAKKYVGHLLHDYRRHYVNSSSFATADGYGFTETQDGAYDVITNIVFRDQAALDEFLRIVNIPEGKAVLQADEEKFMDRSKMCMNLCDGVKTWTAANLTG